MSNLNNNLVTFLRKLADSMEKNELSPEQTKKIGEFFMAYQMGEHEDEHEDEDEDSDFMKFITLGWYVYRMVLDK